MVCFDEKFFLAAFVGGISFSLSLNAMKITPISVLKYTTDIYNERKNVGFGVYRENLAETFSTSVYERNSHTLGLPVRLGCGALRNWWQ